MSPMPAMESQDRKLTIQDFHDFPEDGQRHEVLDGAHVVNPAPGPVHQRVVKRLLRVLDAQVEGHDLGEVFQSPIGAELAPHDIPQPDLLFLSRDRIHLVGPRHIEGPPDLVVEVLSSNKRLDVIDKRARYQAARVPEYWIVDPELESVEVLRLDASATYRTALRLARHTGGGTLDSPRLPGLKVSLDEIF